MKKILAPAKINLYLHVTGKRPDGYHLLDSLMVSTKLYDVIEVFPANTLELEVTGDFANASGENNDNIVIKAANALALAANIKPAAKIKLQKNIPVGAGLGGGSADAAATLKLLNEFWDIGYSLDKLSAIGLSLGADVPFCVYNQAAIVSGIGEVIKPVSISPLHVLLVNPNQHLSTKDVFTHKPINFSKEAGEIPSEAKAFIDFLKSCKNDLEANAAELVPQIAYVFSVIEKQRGCLFSRMSGSGATCFGLFNNEV